MSLPFLYGFQCSKHKQRLHTNTFSNDTYNIFVGYIVSEILNNNEKLECQLCILSDARVYKKDINYPSELFFNNDLLRSLEIQIMNGFLHTKVLLGFCIHQPLLC